LHLDQFPGIEKERIKILNDRTLGNEGFVVYWMQAKNVQFLVKFVI